MTEKELYMELLDKMNNALYYLNKTIEEYDDAFRNLSSGLAVNGTLYKDNTFNNIRNDMINKKNILEHTIISSIKEKIESIE